MSVATRPMRRALAALAAAAVALAALLVVDASPAAADRPPGIPTKTTAQAQLNALTVASESHSGSYDRDLFPHWVTITGNCNAREYVLKRDGRSVTVGSNCYPTGGWWYSDYDATSTSCVSCVHIDHVVALKEAWESGAWSWSTTKRRNFANDVHSPQLWAVSSSSNISKSDKDAAQWIPSNHAVRCDFTKSVITVKYKWGLSVNSAEKSALQSQLNAYC